MPRVRLVGTSPRWPDGARLIRVRAIHHVHEVFFLQSRSLFAGLGVVLGVVRSTAARAACANASSLAGDVSDKSELVDHSCQPRLTVGWLGDGWRHGSLRRGPLQSGPFDRWQEAACRNGCVVSPPS